MDKKEARPIASISDSLDNIIESFTPEKLQDRTSVHKGGKAVTLWYTAEQKEEYEFVQENTGRQFCKLLKEINSYVTAKVAAKIRAKRIDKAG